MFIEKYCDRAFVVGGKAYGSLHGKRAPHYDESYIVERTDCADGYYDIKAGVWLRDTPQPVHLTAPHWIGNDSGDFIAHIQLSTLTRFSLLSSDDETLPRMGGVYVTDSSLCATDGRRLIYHGSTEFTMHHAIVPVNRKVAKIKGELTVYKNYAVMNLATDSVLYIRNIDAQFPAWPCVLPKGPALDIIELPPKQWLEKVVKVGGKKLPRVTMYGNEWRSDVAEVETIPAIHAEPDTVCAFNAQFLLDAWKTGCSNMRTSQRGLITKAVELACSDGSTMIIMPMLID